jgi:cytochrome P450
VIRINPQQLHFNDADFHDDIYAGASRPRDKSTFEHFEKEPGQMSRSVIMTIKHDTHRMRRAPLEKFFSKRTIRELEPVLTSRIELYCDRLERHHKDGTIVSLSDLYAGLTMDIISEYCFGIDPGCAKEPDYGKKYRDMLNGATMTALIFRHFHVLKRLANSLPPWLLLRMSPLFKAWHDFMLLIETCVKSVIDGKGMEVQSRVTIFHDIVNSNLPAAEKSLQRLLDEGVVLIGAGLETSARTLAVLSYYILADADVHRQLSEELRLAMPTPTSIPKSVDLEKLPYLVCAVFSSMLDECLKANRYQTACINEAHRLAMAVPYRFARVAPNEDIKYREYIIPRGVRLISHGKHLQPDSLTCEQTSMSQTSYLLHTNPAVFPNPFAFSPQRWIDNPKLTRNLVPFSRGSRACIGLKCVE